MFFFATLNQLTIPSLHLIKMLHLVEQNVAPGRSNVAPGNAVFGGAGGENRSPSILHALCSLHLDITASTRILPHLHSFFGHHFTEAEGLLLFKVFPVSIYCVRARLIWSRFVAV